MAALQVFSSCRIKSFPDSKVVSLSGNPSFLKRLPWESSHHTGMCDRVRCVKW
ncbi:unnamed protein product, partial [Hymenolepis diminuta]